MCIRDRYKNVEQIYGVEPVPNPVRESFKTIFNTLKDIKKNKIVVIFLCSYFLYIDGVDTIIKMVIPYSKSVLDADKFNTLVLLGILIYVQIVAFPFAIIYGRLASKFGTRNMIKLGIATYMISVISVSYTHLNQIKTKNGLNIHQFLLHLI